MTELTDYEKKVLEEFKERMAEGDFLKYGYLQDFLLKAIRDASREGEIKVLNNHIYHYNNYREESENNVIDIDMLIKVDEQALSEMGVKFPNGKEGN